MIPIRFDCPHCGQNLEVGEEGAGIEIPCPACQNSIQVPAIPASRMAVTAPVNRTRDFKAAATVLSCENCGGQLEFASGDDLAICLFCGSKSVISQPADQIEKLRDAESSELRVSYQLPSVLAKDAPDCVVQAIRREAAGYRSPETLAMRAEGMYLPTWHIAMTVECSWHGQYSTEHTVIKVRTVRKTTSSGHSYDAQEQYNDTETIWHPQSGTNTFQMALVVPAVEGFSMHQLAVAVQGVGTSGNKAGHPCSAPEFAVARPRKSQRQAWQDFGCDGRVDTRATAECRSCIQQLNSVNAVVSSKSYSLI